MSRLSRYKRRRLIIQFIIFLVGIIAVFVFLITIGIDLFVNLTLFISNKSSKPIPDTTFTDTKRILLETPTSSDIPTATNSSELNFTIRATRDSIITIDVNGDRVYKETVISDEIPTKVNLTKGKNSVTLESYLNQEPKTKKKQNYEVLFLTDKPSLEITNPQDNETFDTPNIYIEGKTDKLVLIEINSQPVIVTASQTFKHGVVLKEGDNNFTITATDQAGNIETKNLTLKYEKSD